MSHNPLLRLSLAISRSSFVRNSGTFSSLSVKSCYYTPSHPPTRRSFGTQLVRSGMADFNFFVVPIRPRLHGNGSMWNRTRTVRIGLAFTRELMEPFHTELLVVSELVHLESRSRTEPNQKVLVYTPRTALVRYA